MSSVTINTKTKRSGLSIVLSRWRLGVATCLAALCLATTGNAQTPWTNSGGGFWHTGTNWAGNSPPGPGGTAIFGLPNTYNVLWNNSFGDSVNAGLVVGNDGQVTFSNTSTSTRTYTVLGTSVVDSNVINGSGTRLTVGSFPGNIMQVTSGGWLVDNGGQVIATSGGKVSTPGLITVGSDVSTVFLAIPHLNASAGGVIEASEGRLAALPDSIGRLVVDGSGSQWNSTGSLHVGYSGFGILNVESGGAVNTGAGFIGSTHAGAEGIAWVIGSGSQWNSSDSLAVGSGGTGTLNVEDGGVVNASLGISIGLLPGATGTATVTGSGSQLNSPLGLVVGHSGTGALNVENGGVVTNTVGNIGTYTGLGYTGSGIVTVTGSGSQWNNSDLLRVGFEGTGTLNVTAGGVVGSNQGNIGNEAGSTGAVTVTGSGSQWNNSGLLSVGYSGSGTLNVEDGALVTNGPGIIGFSDDSSGLATVTGNGSQWNNFNDLYVGYSGAGTMAVVAGGLVTSDGGVLGYNDSDSIGIVTVSGSGSRWNYTNGLYVGNGGRGTLNISAGGVVSGGNGGIGGSSSSAVTVSGSGSQWNNTSELSVAAGALNVEAGGVVTDTQGIVGLFAGFSGFATVTGPGSQWNNTGHLYVGSFGNGTLNVTAGGVVTNTVGSIAQENGSLSTATVTGSGSQWNNSDILVVGNNDGDGTLNVTVGGVVTNTQGFIANEGPSTGVVTVNGSGSRWTNSSNLHVGHKGAGTLSVQNGGVVSNATGLVGTVSGSTGTVTVTGSGSRWDNASELNVGVQGTGTLTVEAGAVVTAYHGLIGRFAGSTGTVTVTGSGSRWINAPYLFVGHEGTGTLHVNAGGVVTAEHSAIGTVGGSSGAVTVTGGGSQWNNTGSLIVGHVSNGILNVTAGGVVTSPVGVVGNEAGSSGTVTVTGSGSQWNNSNTLQVGSFGNGTLNIADGGSVTVVNLTAIDAGGQINNSDGSFVSNTVINQAGGEILGRGSFSAVGGWSNSGFMAFRGGVSNVYGPVNNLAGGTIFGEFFGTTYFHGDVVHNGAQIAVGAGSRIEFQGAVSGAGNYFSGGTVAMNGAFRPGNNGPAVVSIANALSFGAGATLEIEIGGLTAGSQHDKLSIGNNLALDGTLDVSLINGFTPTAEQTFNILDWGTLDGDFFDVNLPDLTGALTWDTSDLYTDGTLSVVTPYSADFDGDGDVDHTDLGIWEGAYGTTLAGNADGDNDSDGVDFLTWQREYTGDLSPLAAAMAVPEPGTAVLFAGLSFLWFANRRRNRSAILC